jgi:hypothetical protein
MVRPGYGRGGPSTKGSAKGLQQAGVLQGIGIAYRFGQPAVGRSDRLTEASFADRTGGPNRMGWDAQATNRPVGLMSADRMVDGLERRRESPKNGTRRPLQTFGAWR